MLVELLVVLALLVANGVFAGAEIAVVSQRRTKLLELVEDGRHGAKALLALHEDPERFLATVQIGITVIGASAAVFSGASIAARIEPTLARIPLVAGFADELALGIVVATLSYISIVIGELVPKSLALRSGLRYALLVAQPLQVLAWLARPIVRLLTASSNLVLRPFGDSTTFTEARHSSAEVLQIVEEAVRAGTVNKTAGEIATRALELPELTAADVMVARDQVVMIARTADAARVREVLSEHRYSRLPVHGEDLDDIVGYISIKDVFGLMLTGTEVSIEAVMRPPMFVPRTQRATELLREMKTRRVPFGVVVDELGIMAGIVTMEDVLEELVGDIYSEHAGAAQAPMQREASGATLVSGTVSVREINRELGLELPEQGEWTTIAGLCTVIAGRIPNAGDSLELPDAVTIEIVDASPRRVRTVRIRSNNT